MPLPCRHFSPASITLHFDESTITGTRAISGSLATRFRKRTMAAWLSSMASSMLMSMTCAPFSTCCRATARAFSNSPARIMRAKAFEPVTLVRSPMLTNKCPAASVTGSSPDSFIGGGFLTGTSAAAFSGKDMWQIVGGGIPTPLKPGIRMADIPVLTVSLVSSRSMKVVPLASEGLRIGRPLPFSVRDSSGMVLLARGAAIQTEKQLQLLQSRPIFIDLTESESVKRAYAGQLDQMFRQDVALGRIADARPDYESIPVPGTTRAPDRPLDWPNLQMRLRMLLVNPHGADWIARLRTLRDDILVLVERHPDRALMRLMYDASDDFQDYSANHSLFACVLTSLACTQLAGWKAEWIDSLTLAALTMNLTFTATQDELARQSGPISETQRGSLRDHPERAAALLAEIGVDDPMWLHAVRHHHSAPAGPIAGRAPEDLVARLIRRADRYSARLSPRKSRPASSATAAAQAALLDEGGHGDEAGQALIRTLGLYPPGVWVKLQCGEIAMVLRRTPMAKAPIVASLVSRTGMPLAVPALRNTKMPTFEVTGAVSPAQVKVRPNLDALEKMA